jgi:hypothetical protein
MQRVQEIRPIDESFPFRLSSLCIIIAYSLQKRILNLKSCITNGSFEVIRKEVKATSFSNFSALFSSTGRMYTINLRLTALDTYDCRFILNLTKRIIPYVNQNGKCFDKFYRDM